MMKNKESTWLDGHLASSNPHAVKHSVLTKDVRVPGVSLPHNAIADITRNPHPLDNLMIPQPVSDNQTTNYFMQRITEGGSWGGPSFTPIAASSMPVSVVAGGIITHGVLEAGAKIHGTDHDHGHSSDWTVQDYDILLVDDVFPRSTSLLRTIRREDITVYIGHIHKVDAMRYRAHRGTLADSMATVALLPRNLDALLAHLNKDDIYLNRQLTGDDIEFHQAGYDERVDWVTVWVKVKGFGVVGCIDGVILEAGQ